MDDTYFEHLGQIEEGVSSEKYNSKRKKIFLIGDSICRGYYPFVKKNFEQTHDVIYPGDNCRNSQFIITSLRGWANAFENTENVEVVSFNCGHWDIAHWNGEEESLTNIEEYSHNVKRIVHQLKKFFPKAKILFFTTTPMNPSYKMDSQNPRSNDEIRKYNKAAIDILELEDVVIEDLHVYMERWDKDNFIDYVHLKKNAAEQLGNHITDVIKKLL